MYIAHGNEVFYLHPFELTEELFLTVHPTKDCSLTIEEQAGFLASLLNARVTARQVERDIF